MLDYSLKTTEERIACVADVLASTPKDKLTKKYKEIMADYILMTTEHSQTKKEKASEYQILTKNREITINKRQVSYEQVIDSLENGEDGIYALMTDNHKQYLDNKNKISNQEIESSPALKRQMDLIDSLKKQLDATTGTARFAIKRQIIEAWQQLYILKASLSGGAPQSKSSNQMRLFASTPIREEITMGEDGMPHVDALLSLLVPEHVCFLLTYYSALKEESYDDLNSDMHWLLIDLENLIERALANQPTLKKLIILKVDGLSNEEIRSILEERDGIVHTEQYYSTLWRKRIPKLIATQAKKEWIQWYYSNVAYGDWKYCATCGQWKPAHPMFFTRNTSKDGWYSRCKECRQKHQ